MDRNEIARRYALANSTDWKDIKELLLDKIIEYAKGSSRSSDEIRGMLSILSVPENWVSAFFAEKNKVAKERNEQ